MSKERTLSIIKPDAVAKNLTPPSTQRLDVELITSLTNTGENGYNS